ncbi:MAG: barstar family protein, partial [Bacteroidota bacterium]
MEINCIKPVEIILDFLEIHSEEELHKELALIFGFPDFYGNNIHALIDCWSSLRFPQDQMSKICLDRDQALF